MSIDDAEAEEAATPMAAETDIKELMGLFDAPAFARRGQDMEFALRRLHERCRRQRDELLEMVRMRLKQWARAAAGPETWSQTFADPPGLLWDQAGPDEPSWASQPASPRTRLGVARDLVASVERFNQRWRTFLGSLKLEPVNHVIDQYNKYYVIEKECVVGSSRLAARHFKPVPRLSMETLLKEHPLLPVPAPIGRPRDLSRAGRPV